VQPPLESADAYLRTAGENMLPSGAFTIQTLVPVPSASGTTGAPNVLRVTGMTLVCVHGIGLPGVLTLSSRVSFKAVLVAVALACAAVIIRSANLLKRICTTYRAGPKPVFAGVRSAISTRCTFLILSVLRRTHAISGSYLAYYILYPDWNKR